MTDRVSTLTVVLDDDLRDDDAATVANLISAIRGIAGVTLGPARDVNDLVVRQRIARDLRNELVDAIDAALLKR